jgi:hypothetical protein
MSDIRRQWTAFLSMALEQHRGAFPEDERSDHAILTELMEHFVRHGTVKKKDGKFALPEIVEDAP